MSKLTPEGIEKVFEMWNEVVVRHPDDTPEPLDFDELRERLNLSIKPGQISSQSLLDMAEAVLGLPRDTADLPLIEASYFWLVKQHAPWAIKKKG